MSDNISPTHLHSKTIRLRLAAPDDAAFIYALRTDPRYNTYLSSVSDGVEAQRNWLCRYKDRELAGTEYYFIIETIDETPCGTVRIYDITDESFCWGSWILNENKTRYAALESALIVYRVGFSSLGKKYCRFDVRKENVSVIKFHKRFEPEITGEDEDNIYFEFPATAFLEMEKKFQNFLDGENI